MDFHDPGYKSMTPDGDKVRLLKEIVELQSINAELLAACADAKRMYGELAEHAQAGRPAIVPVTIVQRLNAAIERTNE